jgi:hypothetical protein
MNRVFMLCVLLVLVGCGRSEPSKTPSPSTADTSQLVRDTIKVPDAPKTARRIDAFRSLRPTMTMAEVVRQCGYPDSDIGSGIHIFVYRLDDGSTVRIGTPDLQRMLYATHTEKSGKEDSLFEVATGSDASGK